jgi:hypothetical protein
MIKFGQGRKDYFDELQKPWLYGPAFPDRRDNTAPDIIG